MPTGYPRGWTDDEDALVIAAYAEGQTLAQIAELIGCEISHLWERLQTLRAAGHDLPPRKPRWTDDRRQRLANLRRQGRSLSELEAEFQVTRGSITSQLRTLSRLGYDLGPAGYGA